MIPLYTLFLSALGGLKWVLAGRAARTEKKYTAAALEAEQAARQAQVKPGNASQPDVFAAAKRQYELGRLVQLRDQLEVRYHGWQGRADRIGKLVARLRGVKGRLVPYLFGVVDVVLVMAALHYLGLPHDLDKDKVTAWAETMKP
jgi:hypothetical protein